MDPPKTAFKTCDIGLVDNGSYSQTSPEKTDTLSELLRSPRLDCGYDRHDSVNGRDKCKSHEQSILLNTDEYKMNAERQRSVNTYLSNPSSVESNESLHGMSALVVKREVTGDLTVTSDTISNLRDYTERKLYVPEHFSKARAEQMQGIKEQPVMYSKLSDDICNSKSRDPSATFSKLAEDICNSRSPDQRATYSKLSDDEGNRESCNQSATYSKLSDDESNNKSRDQSDVPIQHNVVSSTRPDEMDDDHQIFSKTTNDCDQIMGTPQAVDDESRGNGSSFKRSLRQRKRRVTLPSRSRHRRETLQDMARPLKRWLCAHKHHPYPSKQDKQDLSLESAMTLTQVSNWFANARRRLKNTVGDEGLSWETRILQYNDHVVGKAELLSISSEDSDLDSDDEHMEWKDKLSSDNIDLGICYTQSPLPPEASAHETMLQRFLREPLEQHNLEEGSCNQRHDLDTHVPFNDREYVDTCQTEAALSKSSPSLHGDKQDLSESGPTSTDISSCTHTFQCRDADLHWKEVSAALVLSSLAHSVH